MLTLKIEADRNAEIAGGKWAVESCNQEKGELKIEAEELDVVTQSFKGSASRGRKYQLFLLAE